MSPWLAVVLFCVAAWGLALWRALSVASRIAFWAATGAAPACEPRTATAPEPSAATPTTSSEPETVP